MTQQTITPLFPFHLQGILNNISPIILKHIPSLLSFQIQPDTYIKTLSDLITKQQIDCNLWLKQCAFRGHINIVKLLLKDGRADPTKDNSICLSLSAMEGYIDIVKLLLEDGRADSCAYYSDCLRVSADFGRTEIVIRVSSHIHAR